jgi:hypothetical protein
MVSANGLTNGSSGTSSSTPPSNGHPTEMVHSPAPGLRRVLNKATLSPNLLRTSYAVRGPLAILADQLQADLSAAQESGREAEEEVVRRRGWRNVVNTNIGNPQALGQRPVTFFRQVGGTGTRPVVSGLDGLEPNRPSLLLTGIGCYLFEPWLAECKAWDCRWAVCLAPFVHHILTTRSLHSHTGPRPHKLPTPPLLPPRPQNIPLRRPLPRPNPHRRLPRLHRRLHPFPRRTARSKIGR